jgi:hypothetical protein
VQTFVSETCIIRHTDLLATWRCCGFKCAAQLERLRTLATPTFLGPEALQLRYPRHCRDYRLSQWVRRYNSVQEVRRCIQKFPDCVDNKINNNKHPLRSNKKGYGGKTHYNDSQNSDTTTPSGRELNHLQFSRKAASPETSGYTLVSDSSLRKVLLLFLSPTGRTLEQFLKVGHNPKELRTKYERRVLHY